MGKKKDRKRAAKALLRELASNDVGPIGTPVVPAVAGRSSISGIPASPLPPPALPESGESMAQPLIGTSTGYLSTQVSWDPNLTENPDEVMLARYGTYTYQEMDKNPHVIAAITRALGETLGEDYDFLPFSEEEEDVEVAAFLRHVMDPDSPWFITKLWGMGSSFGDGLSITEKVWGRLDTGPWKGAWVARDFKTKDPKQYRLLMDKYRNPIGCRDRWATGDTPYFDRSVFILMTWMEKYSNKFGTSAKQAARAPYEFLCFITRSRMKYLEIWGKASRVGKYTGKDDKIRQKYFDALKNWGDEFVMIHGPDFEFDIPMAVSDQGAHDAAAKWAADEVAIAILGTADSGKTQASGAKGQGAEKRAGLLVDLVWRMFILAITEDYIKPLVMYNYPLAYARGAIPRMVRLKDETMTYEEANALTLQRAIWADAVENRGIKVEKATWAEKFSVERADPDADEEDLVESAPTPPPSPFGGGGGIPHPGAGPVQNPGGSQEPGGDHANDNESDEPEKENAEMSDKTPVPRGTPRTADEIFVKLLRISANSEALAAKEFGRTSRALRSATHDELKKKALGRSFHFRGAR